MQNPESNMFVVAWKAKNDEITCALWNRIFCFYSDGEKNSYCWSLDSIRAFSERTVRPLWWNAFRLKNALIEFIEWYSRLSVMPWPEILWWRRMLLFARDCFVLYLSSRCNKQSLVVLAASSKKIVWCESGEPIGTSRLNCVTRNLVRRVVIGHGVLWYCVVEYVES